MSNPVQGNSEAGGYLWTPVALPVGRAGVDLRAAPAGRNPLALRELLNARFLHDRSVGKRAGHLSSPLMSNDPYPQTDTEENPPWLLGWGATTYTGFASSPSKPPYFPVQNRGGGICTLGDTLVGWTGDRLLLHRDGQARWLDSRGIPAVLPTSIEDRWDVGDARGDFYDMAADTTTLVAVSVKGGIPRVTVRNRETGAWVLREVTLGVGTALAATVVHSAGYFVAIWSTTTELLFSYANSATPEVWSAPSVWAACSGEFDVDVASDDLFLVGYRDGTNVRIAYWSGNGTVTTPAAPGTVLTTAAGNPTGAVGICVGRDGFLGLVWAASGGAGATYGGTYTASGAVAAVGYTVSAEAGQRVTIGPHWNYRSTGASVFSAWADHNAGFQQVNGTEFDTKGDDNTLPTRANCYLNTRAFRVGDNVVVGLLAVPTSGTAQALGFFHSQPVTGNGSPLVVGAYGRGESSPALVVTSHVTGVRPEPGQGYNTYEAPTTPLWVTSHTRARFIPGQLVDYQPTSLLLDFLPPLRSAQYGAATYFAGSIVQVFDGNEVVEAGFLQYPEVVSVVSSTAAGSLTPGMVRSYRVYAVHRNSSGELARSPALSFRAPAVGVGHDTNTVTFTNIAATSRESRAGFEVYATEDGGTTYYLLTLFPPANSPTTPTSTFVDSIDDATLRNRPADSHAGAPGDPVEISETAPPGCTVLCAAKERLFFAGGSLPPGRIAFSKLREDTEQAGWDDLAGTLNLDTTPGRVVSLIGFADILLSFQESAVYGLQGDGPDNLGRGNFPPAQLLVPSAGATIHEGTAVSERGVVFWAEAGPRLVTPGMTVMDISLEVEPLARELGPLVTGCVVHPGNREVRWYTSDGRALLWDYSGRSDLGNRWAVWSGLPCAGAVYYPRTRGAVVVQPDGNVLVEDETLRTDGGNHYEYAFRTGDIRPTELIQGENKVGKIGFSGEFMGPHTLGVWAYYDGSPLWDEFFTWTPVGQVASIGWGTGSGTWDTDPTAWIDPTTPSPDGVYRMRRRLPRLPFATLSLRCSDMGAPGDSFIITEVALELASLTGITHTPPRTFGG